MSVFKALGQKLQKSREQFRQFQANLQVSLGDSSAEEALVSEQFFKSVVGSRLVVPWQRYCDDPSENIGLALQRQFLAVLFEQPSVGIPDPPLSLVEALVTISRGVLAAATIRVPLPDAVLASIQVLAILARSPANRRPLVDFGGIGCVELAFRAAVDAFASGLKSSTQDVAVLLDEWWELVCSCVTCVRLFTRAEPPPGSSGHGPRSAQRAQ
eukprot:RCo026322